MFDNISDLRRTEIENTALKCRKIVQNTCDLKGVDNYFIIRLPHQMLSESLKLSKKLFKLQLNHDEEKLFSLYSILPDDKEFMSILAKNEFNKEKFATKYGVTVNIITLRYKYILQKRREELKKESHNKIKSYE